MESATTFLKQNFDLVMLLVGILGVAVSIIAVACDLTQQQFAVKEIDANHDKLLDVNDIKHYLQSADSLQQVYGLDSADMGERIALALDMNGDFCLDEKDVELFNAQVDEAQQ